MQRYFLLILLLCNVVVASAENNGRKQANKSSAVTIHYQGYSVSYNPDLLIPNWVSYELLAAETDGPFTRKGKYFRQDSSTKVKQADNSLCTPLIFPSQLGSVCCRWRQSRAARFRLVI